MLNDSRVICGTPVARSNDGASALGGAVPYTGRALGEPQPAQDREGVLRRRRPGAGEVVECHPNGPAVGRDGLAEVKLARVALAVAVAVGTHAARDLRIVRRHQPE